MGDSELRDSDSESAEFRLVDQPAALRRPSLRRESLDTSVVIQESFQKKKFNPLVRLATP